MRRGSSLTLEASRRTRRNDEMKMRLLVGLLLVAVSAPPLALMARELTIGSNIAARYAVDGIISRERRMEGGALRAEIDGHVVALEDDQPVNETGDLQVEGVVRVVVDGRDYSHPAKARIRLARRDANRYWGFVYLMRLIDKHESSQRLVVAQSLGSEGYRTLSVSGDGRVVEDRFDYAGRCTPPLRALLIRYVVPHPSGFCSDVMQVWPTIFYPLLYPWASGALGLGCVVAGVVSRLRHRRHTHRLMPDVGPTKTEFL